tara:strand:- start:2145 stop:2495 length:351 start_codon:yes stop_codon:yes gene_type:complete
MDELKVKRILKTMEQDLSLIAGVFTRLRESHKSLAFVTIPLLEDKLASNLISIEKFDKSKNDEHELIDIFLRTRACMLIPPLFLGIDEILGYTNLLNSTDLQRLVERLDSNETGKT